MDSTIPELPFLKNIGLLMTLRCQAACPHCIVDAGPHRDEEMRLEDAFDWMEQAASYGNGLIRVISLTGGEPFIDVDRLKAISDFAARLGLLASAVTNAQWASSPENARQTLEKLPALKMIQISTDVYHQKFIPFENVANAIGAAKACGVPFTLAVCTENEKNPAHLDLIGRLDKIVDPEAIYTAITFRAGRALARSGGHDYETSSTPPTTACGTGGSPIIFPDGRVIACIGPVIDIDAPHPLALGSLRHSSLSEILEDAEENAILHAIRIWGPGKLFAILREAGLGAILPDRCIKGSVCHACYDLMSRPEVVQFLEKLRCNTEFQRMVAYGRAYYLGEPQMVLRLELNN